jgi:hypothetical protein
VVLGGSQETLFVFLRYLGHREILYLGIQLCDTRSDILCFGKVDIVLCGHSGIHCVQRVGMEARGAYAVRTGFKLKLVEVLVILFDSA